ncbi:efflux transporter, RND family, MFP subunit [Gluconacetobacter diazotrophicus PA1 5]|uniref:Efflux RND transporter periplasmic adaptor subunit n=2 Tax=Gluconacetobacter diazotrophicus TaxID=33996 RepID=A0A7W4I3S0_GLUDI|nr:efflux RND transporter periplasmic adaptor subunit [Gluconacetobacter diazotrophicus]ACI51216.1 efflux transporter, RND family, MFP subunit [Gluconacetobacter diazotrophicus PA1 5]MBB2155071.1 efflux RND transporter periplasmic adaptor subunit [Gluconacetobacter diazotrophicus]TWB09772.1 RND family efflux transporter MFP subunit [Gluconacetobacter diazotrophicus]CAP54506.1 putative multidrug resistance protein mdtA precursor [Gluconacetobacter diazotrophicus PA1 5]
MTEGPKAGRGRAGLLLAGLLLVAIGVAGWGIWSRVHAGRRLARATDDAAVATVAVVPAQAGPDVEEIVLPGSVSAAYDTPIYARTSGYIQRWYTDIGTRVKAGDLLATIESPEIDQQLRQARADLMTARANNMVAQATARRVHALLPTRSVSAQQNDQAASDAAARAATVASNEANVQRLEQLVGFEKVVAPYDGIVTARETDNGSLITAGSGSGAELFRVTDTSWLRVYVQVPQTYAPDIRIGLPVELRFPEYPGRAFPATLTRTAGALQPDARTLLVQLRADNAQGALLPGGYTEVHFKLRRADRGVRIPANALLFRAEGLRVATLSPDGRASLHAITQGRDFGTTVEILTGIAPGDRVILNPPSSLADGERVHVASPAPAQAAARPDRHP